MKEELVSVLKQFWETEDIGIKSNEFEKPYGKVFLPDISFTGERYEIGLACKGESLAIDDDWDLSTTVLDNFNGNCKHNPKTRQENQRATGDGYREGFGR